MIVVYPERSEGTLRSPMPPRGSLRSSVLCSLESRVQAYEKKYLPISVAFVLLFASFTPAQSKKSAVGPCTVTDVKEDIAAQVAKFKPVEMPFNSAGLSAQERKMVEKLVEAS